jgi:hypothetical protein
MLEIKSDVYINSRTGLTMFRLTMHNAGKVSNTETDYRNVLNKSNAESTICDMINKLCDMTYPVSEENSNKSFFKR